MRKDDISLLNKILAILSLILALILIYMLILKLTGHSPEDTTILSLFISLLTSLQIVILGQIFSINKVLGELEEFKKRIEMDMRDIKEIFKKKRKKV